MSKWTKAEDSFLEQYARQRKKVSTHSAKTLSFWDSIQLPGRSPASAKGRFAVLMLRNTELSTTFSKDGFRRALFEKSKTNSRSQEDELAVTENGENTIEAANCTTQKKTADTKMELQDDLAPTSVPQDRTSPKFQAEASGISSTSAEPEPAISKKDMVIYHRMVKEIRSHSGANAAELARNALNLDKTIGMLFSLACGGSDVPDIYEKLSKLLLLHKQGVDDNYSLYSKLTRFNVYNSHKAMQYFLSKTTGPASTAETTKTTSLVASTSDKNLDQVDSVLYMCKLYIICMPINWSTMKYALETVNNCVNRELGQLPSDWNRVELFDQEDSGKYKCKLIHGALEEENLITLEIGHNTLTKFVQTGDWIFLEQIRIEKNVILFNPMDMRDRIVLWTSRNFADLKSFANLKYEVEKPISVKTAIQKFAGTSVAVHLPVLQTHVTANVLLSPSTQLTCLTFTKEKLVVGKKCFKILLTLINGVDYDIFCKISACKLVYAFTKEFVIESREKISLYYEVSYGKNPIVFHVSCANQNETKAEFEVKVECNLN